MDDPKQDGFEHAKRGFSQNVYVFGTQDWWEYEEGRANFLVSQLRSTNADYGIHEGDGEWEWYVDYGEE